LKCVGSFISNHLVGLSLKSQMEDHLQIGARMKLFCQNEHGKGCTFFTPDGTQLFNDLKNYSVNTLKKKGYREIMTPQMFTCAMWNETGHLDNYFNNMIMLQHNEHESAENVFALKPMNCIGHAAMFQHLCQSEHQLPMRFIEYSPVYRNEPTESLIGLFRLRQFTQDSAHIFCTVNHIVDEIKSVIAIMKNFYKLFAFNFKVTVSTKPQNCIGFDEIWNDSEAYLKECAVELDPDFQIKEGEGAFYAPKIDVSLTDVNGHLWQCGSIQLDLNTGPRIGLQYMQIGIENEGKSASPVIIHHTIMGSIERFIGILLEHTQGHLPYWLTSRQIYMTVGCNTGQICEPKLFDYMKHIEKVFIDNSIMVNINTTEPLASRISKALEQGFNYIFIIGSKDVTNNTITYRCREHNYTNINSPIEDVFKQISKEYDCLLEPTTTKTEKPATVQTEKPVTAQTEKPVTAQTEKPVTAQTEKPVANECLINKPVIMTDSSSPPFYDAYMYG
jgi:threonyl-tRNA synthetase